MQDIAFPELFFALCCYILGKSICSLRQHIKSGYMCMPLLLYVISIDEALHEPNTIF